MLGKVKNWLSGLFDSALGNGPPPYDPERVIFAGEDRDAEGRDYSFSYYTVPKPYSFKGVLQSGSAQDETVIAMFQRLKPGQTMRIIKDLNAGCGDVRVASIEDISTGIEYHIPNTDYPPPSLKLDEVRRAAAGREAVKAATERIPVIK